MGEQDMKMVVLIVDELLKKCETDNYCRICHEAEFESCKSLEAPCSCSGTVKFAHRECIQRWCNEKGNTICELCLQNYEPGYAATSKTIRYELETTRSEDDDDLESEEQDAIVYQGTAADAVNFGQCMSTSDRSEFCLRSFAVTVTVFLLLRHLFVTITGHDGTEDYPFTPLTVFILRSSGIILPVFIILRASTAIQKGFRQQYQQYQDLYNYNDDAESKSDEDEEEDAQHLA